MEEETTLQKKTYDVYLGILRRLVIEVVSAEELAAVGEGLLAEEGDGVGVSDAALLDTVVSGEWDAAAVAGELDLGAVRLGALEQPHVADLVLVVAADLHLVPPAGVRRRLCLVVNLLRLEVTALHLHRGACMQTHCFVTQIHTMHSKWHACMHAWASQMLAPDQCAWLQACRLTLDGVGDVGLEPGAAVVAVDAAGDDKPATGCGDGHDGGYGRGH